MKTNFLDQIRPQIEKRIAAIPDLQIEPKNTINFYEIFTSYPHPRIISEIKFASPARGKIYPGKLSHIDIALEYLKAGCAALSVLAEPQYFKGHIDFIQDIRATAPAHTPILLKDFILSKKQIVQGSFYGANAVLLIAGLLDERLLTELYEYSLFLGLTPIIEVHDERELEQVLPLSPPIIGINNRNLVTLEINLNTSRNLIKNIPDDCNVICESGIDNAEQIRELIELGFDGFLIGSSLMQNANPGLSLQKLIAEVQHES